MIKVNSRFATILRGVVTGTTLLLVTPLAHAEPEVEGNASPPRLAPGLKLSLSVEPGLAVALTEPQSQRTEAGMGQTIKLLFGVTRYLGVELAPHNITVNAVSPGIVDTDALRHFAALRGDQAIGNVAKATPAGRLVLPEEVAELVAFLCTPAARMIIGQTILMDGGASLPMRGPAEGEGGRRAPRTGRKEDGRQGTDYSRRGHGRR